MSAVTSALQHRGRDAQADEMATGSHFALLHVGQPTPETPADGFLGDGFPYEFGQEVAAGPEVFVGAVPAA